MQFVLGLLALGGGALFQNCFRCSPRWNLGVTCLVVIIFSPAWSMGWTLGSWFSCAFLTYHPENELRDMPQGWLAIFCYAGFSFSGFILTLILLWKAKMGMDLPLMLYQEILGWMYLIGLEICFYKVIALATFRGDRFQLGYGIGFLNSLMLLYWVYPYGWMAMVLTSLTLLAVNPLLLLMMDRCPQSKKGMLMG